MAVMIPEIPNPFQPGSLEDVMFEALKSLPDSCMVFHSFRLTDVKDGILKDRFYHFRQGKRNSVPGSESGSCFLS